MDRLEQEIRNAYESSSMPHGLREKTLAYVDAQRDKTSKRRRPGRRMRYRSLIALAACLILIVAGFGTLRMQTGETAFVSIDVNPSFELGLNRFNVVTSVSAFNDDARGMLEGLSLKGMSFDEAMARLAASDGFKGYLTGTSFMDINIVCSDKKQSDRLLSASQSYLEGLPCEGSCRATSSELRTEAHDANMGVGRYQAALELIALDNSITLDDCRSLTMRELRDKIAFYNGGEGSGAGGTDGTEAAEGTGGSTMQGGRGMPQGQGQHQGQSQHHEATAGGE
jgi:hypothetical protein